MRTAVFSAIIGGAGLLLNTFAGAPVTNQTFVILTMVLVIMGVSTRMIMRQILIQIYRSGSERLRILVYGGRPDGPAIGGSASHG